MEMLQASELLSTRTGAPSGPRMRQLKGLPVAFTRMLIGLSLAGQLRGGRRRLAEEVLQQWQQQLRRLRWHHVHRVDELEARAIDVARHLLAASGRADLVVAAG